MEVEAPEAVVEEEVAPEEEAPVEVEAPEAVAEEEVAPEEVIELVEEVYELDESVIATLGLGDGEEILDQARALRDSGDADGALDLYEKLIRQEQLLSSVLADLEEGVSGRLAQPRTLTLIGDLCTKQGRLQRALEAYRQALDMLKQ